MSIARDIVTRLKDNPESYGADGANVNLQKDKAKTKDKAGNGGGGCC